MIHYNDIFLPKSEMETKIIFYTREANIDPTTFFLNFSGKLYLFFFVIIRAGAN